MFYHPNMISGMHASDAVAAIEALAGATSAPRSDALHRTLVLVDGSDRVDRAVAHADALARAGSTSEIHLLSVQPLVLQGDVAFLAQQTARIAAAQEAIRRAQAQIHSAVPVRTAVRFGHVARAVVQYAREQGIDAIVASTPAKRSLRTLFRRPFAMDVARRLGIPVTLVGPADDGDREAMPYRRIAAAARAGANPVPLLLSEPS
jgi:nucleotide-binding universal stress UspA family protein